MMLKLQSLSVSLAKSDTTILDHITAQFAPGEVTYIVGPNGSGKSSLLHAIMGSPFLEVKEGGITLDGEDLIPLAAHERAKKGLFVSFQEPPGIPGVKVMDYLYNIYTAQQEKQIDAQDLYERVLEELKKVNLSPEILQKELHLEFSGGEKKRLEVLSLFLLKPKYIFLDELDSGLDVDAVELLFKDIKEYYAEHKPSLVIVSHHFRVAKILPPDKVIMLRAGKIAAEGGRELLEKVESSGFSNS